MTKKQKKIELPKREIKFRAWNLETKTMHYASKEPHTDDEGYLWRSVLLLDCDGWSIWKVPENVWYRGVKEDKRELLVNYENGILMQYTGLKDKNGREIYEGDIVKIDGSKKLRRVFWDDAGFYIDGEDENTKEDLMYSVFYKVITIIGNIFQNPELLN